MGLAAGETCNFKTHRGIHRNSRCLHKFVRTPRGPHLIFHKFIHTCG